MAVHRPLDGVSFRSAQKVMYVVRQTKDNCEQGCGMVLL